MDEIVAKVQSPKSDIPSSKRPYIAPLMIEHGSMQTITQNIGIGAVTDCFGTTFIAEDPDLCGS